MVLTPAPRVTTELRQTRLGECRIHSEHAGAGEPVVLLHGLSGSRRWWRFTLPVLARHFSVHVPELVGFGRSRGARQPDMGEMAAVLREWLDELGIGGYRLVGHSMGGQIAMHLAVEQRMPERLVLVNASGLPRSFSPREAARLMAGALPLRRWGAPTFMPTIAADAVRAGPRALMRSAWHLLRDDVSGLLSAVTCPTLVMWGELDPIIPLEYGRAFAAGIPGARLAVIADAAHNPMADRPAEFNRRLLQFLEVP